MKKNVLDGKTYLSSSLEETLKIGEMISKSLPDGSVILAEGELGAGKTALAKGVAKGLGIKEIVNSPTFVIVKEYQGENKHFNHIDAYRLEGEEEVTDIGLEELLGEEGSISYVEWSEFIQEYIDRIKVHLFKVKITFVDEEKRRIEFEVIHE
ncbi:MAG TPA: tRNA (adenosine(37)-N6)-threonylcarbamoyltransferase complex ATPase subunit type 1 TsaE [Firmicutes bacterium]|nr:tRNA (adenosine(37)-N6)-threonylcarbamoyltransferase complex ATPase subunit type 1 TsaE [Bacillota bacterium]